MSEGTRRLDSAGGDRARPRPSWWEVIAVAIGVAAMSIQFASRRSLWVDEIAVVHNLDARSLGELLTQPLDYDQVAPSIFLLIQKGIFALVGAGEFSMRAYPFAMGVLALLLTWALARRLLDGSWAALPPLLLGISAEHVWLSSQAKQYSGDLALTAALLLIGVVSQDRDPSRWRRWGMVLVGITAPWMSQPALFALAAAGGALLWGDWRHARRLSLGTVATVGAWGISGLLALASAQGRVSTGTMQFMRDYWSSGFLPFPPRTWDELKWPAYTLRVIIAEVTDWRWSYAYFALAVVGGWAVWRRSRPVALTLAAPIVGAMAAAALGRYPLEGRLAFFLAPIAVLLVSAGIAAVATLAKGPRWATAAMALLLITPPLLSAVRSPPPYTLQHTRPLFERLQREYRPGDRVYVPYGGWQAWWYYAPRTGLGAVPVLVGSCHDTALAGYEAEVRQLHDAARTWILFVAAGELQGPDVIVRAADTFGERRATYTERHVAADGTMREVVLMRFDRRPTAGGRDDEPAPRGAPTGPLPAACRGAAVDRLLARR